MNNEGKKNTRIQFCLIHQIENQIPQLLHIQEFDMLDVNEAASCRSKGGEVSSVEASEVGLTVVMQRSSGSESR